MSSTPEIKTPREQLLEAFRTYCSRTGKSFSTAGNYAVNDGDFYRRITEDGAGFTESTWTKAMTWFAANTPAEAPAESASA